MDALETTEPKGGTMGTLNVSRDDLVGLFTDYQFPSVANWPLDRMMGKIKNLPKLVKDDNEEIRLTVNSKKTLEALLEALDSKDEIVVTGYDEPAAPKTENPAKKNGKAPGKKPAAAAKKPAKGKNKPAAKEKASGKTNGKAPARKPATADAAGKKADKGKDKPAAKEKANGEPVKEPAGKDEFGYRLGTVRAQVNAVLSKKKPLTMAEIVELAKMPWTPGNHMREMVAKGHAKKTDKGFVLA